MHQRASPTRRYILPRPLSSPAVPRSHAEYLLPRSSPAGRSFNSGSYPFPNTVRRSRFYDIPTQSLAVESWMESRNKGTFLRIWPATAQSSSHDCSYNMGGLLIHQGVGCSSQHGLRCPISIRARLKDAFTKCPRLSLRRGILHY